VVSVLGQDRSETKKSVFGLGLGLAGLVLYCETRSCHAGHHTDLEGHCNFQVLFIVSLFCAWNITTVKINSVVHLLKSQISQVPLFTRYWSWSCNFGLGLGLVSSGLGLGLLILVLVLRIISCLHHWYISTTR